MILGGIHFCNSVVLFLVFITILRIKCAFARALQALEFGELLLFLNSAGGDMAAALLPFFGT